jgi:hypothetical protein
LDSGKDQPKNVVNMDGTYNSNKINYPVYAMTVRDEQRMCVPVAFMTSSGDTSTEVCSFVKAVEVACKVEMNQFLIDKGKNEVS